MNQYVRTVMCRRDSGERREITVSLEQNRSGVTKTWMRAGFDDGYSLVLTELVERPQLERLPL